MDNTYTGGECYGGGVGIWYGAATLANNVIMGNQAKYGAGISIADTTMFQFKTVMTNNTITENIASENGHGLFVELWKEEDGENQLDTLILVNNIIWNDEVEEGEMIFHERGDMFVAFSDVKGGWPGEGNIELNPEFTEDGYHLNFPSLLVNAGCASVEIAEVAYHCPADDIDGDERPYSETNPDMGADEALWEGVHIHEPDRFDQRALCLYPNPFSQQAELDYYVDAPGRVTLTIVNQLGKTSATLVDEIQPQGNHKLFIDGSNLKPGVYFCVMTTANSKHTMKFIKLQTR
jgi:hypothetical protein